jgi:hypothetical protein
LAEETRPNSVGPSLGPGGARAPARPLNRIRAWSDALVDLIRLGRLLYFRDEEDQIVSTQCASRGHHAVGIGPGDRTA